MQAQRRLSVASMTMQPSVLILSSSFLRSSPWRQTLNGKPKWSLKASMMASAVSARPQVRAFLLEMQRKLARENNVIMDGRDIGTVVLPDADVKIYLTASAEIRAERRLKELLEKGQQVTYDEVYRDMVKRDYDDMHREIAPLKKAEDAVTADTGALDFDSSVELILEIVKRETEKK